jgi:DNA-binding NtrC family response regulator
VGGTRDRLVRFRLVLSTQQPAALLVKSGRWRPDFYYRVAGISLDVPPLTERMSDIPLLVDHFLALLDRPPLRLDEPGILGSYPWHGNVRELKRGVERAAFVAGDRAVTAADIHEAISELQVLRPGSSADSRLQGRSLRDLQRQHISAVLTETRGDTHAAAMILGLSRSQVYRRMQELGIAREQR